MKLDVKKMVEQAGQGVKDGFVVVADKAQHFASDAAVATAEGIDQIRESIAENKILSDSIKPIQTVINDLKEDNAIQSEFLELMQDLLDLLCAVVDGLKHDDTTKLGIIDAAFETLEEWRKDLDNLDLKGMHIDHIGSWYGVAYDACMDSYRILEKSGIEEKLKKKQKK